MNYGQALSILNLGGVVTRSAWFSSWLTMVWPKESIEAGPMYDVPSLRKFVDGPFLPWIGIRTEDGSFAPWTADPQDMIARDWDRYYPEPVEEK